MTSVKIVGHRGAAGAAPENTLAGFQRAYELGLRSVETDVQLTADGVPILFHDDRLDRLTPERGPVRARTWKQLREVPVMPGSFGGAFPDARIPSLEEAIRSLPEDLELVVELKPDPDRSEELVRRTLRTLQDAAALRRSRIISFDHDLLRVTRRERPSDLRLGVLATPRDAALLLPAARELRAEVIHAHHSVIDSALIRSARDEGFQINGWTVNTGEECLRLAELGVDEITTDYPDRARMAL